MADYLDFSRWVAIKELAREQPIRLVVIGDCMSPVLKDEFRVEVSSKARYFPGDIVLICPENGGRPFIHRLLGAYPGIKGIRYLTQGDNLPRPDASVIKPRIIGSLSSVGIANHPVNIPFSHRVRALFRFFRFIQIRIVARYVFGK